MGNEIDRVKEMMWKILFPYAKVPDTAGNTLIEKILATHGIVVMAEDQSLPPRLTSPLDSPEINKAYLCGCEDTSKAILKADWVRRAV